MIWFAALALSALALIPLAFSLRQGVGARGRREAALALHRAQLAEVDRDFAEGRIAPAEHVGAVLEVQRRLLGAAAMADRPSGMTPRGPIWAALVLVPVAALLLYASGGSPNLPSMPLKARIAAAQQELREEEAMLVRLRAVLATLDPHSEQAREGFVLLGGAEARMGDFGAAAAAWDEALAVRFDPTLAAEAAEAATQAAGRVTDKAAALFERALAAAPRDAPWRPMAERRLAERPAARSPGQ